MARPHALADPDFARQVAEAFVAGGSRKEMADMFGVQDLNTITRWRRDPRIKVLTQKLIEDRILQITRRVDTKIQKMLETEDLTLQELIMVRKEFLGTVLRQKYDKADEDTIGEAQDWLENNPDLADEFEKSFNKNVE